MPVKWALLTQILHLSMQSEQYYNLNLQIRHVNEFETLKSIGYYKYHKLWHYKSQHFAHSVFWLILRIKYDYIFKQYQTFNIIKEEKCSLRCWNLVINIIYINFGFKCERSSRLCLMEFGVRNCDSTDKCSLFRTALKRKPNSMISNTSVTLC